jgi:thiol-disulfide isomerase/thioredoxin
MIPASSIGTVVAFALITGCVETARAPVDRSGHRSVDDHEAPEPRTLRRPQFVAADRGELRSIVVDAMTRARAESQTLIVYVGASWCEPCVAFHRALERGDLDTTLPSVVFLELDADLDAQRIEAAGYSGRLIPRFVVPKGDGAASGLAVEGGIKGDGAVDHIVQRLAPLLAKARSEPM